MQWTEKQKEVIEDRGSDLLVSAAAGSGKTAVLVERIKRLIIEDGVDIDRLLIVTFTRAAASEMKEKIADALMEQALSEPETAALMQKQMDRLNDARISTIDSFVIDIVRQYFYVIDIEPDLKIISPEESALIRNDAMDLVFEELYEEDESWFTDLLDGYSGHKNDLALKERIMTLYEQMMSMPDGLKWFEQALDVLSLTEEEFMESSAAQVIFREKDLACERAGELIRIAYDTFAEAGLENTAEKLTDELDQIEAIKEADGSDVWDRFEELSFARMGAGKGEKDAYSEIKDDAIPFRDEGKKLLTDLKSRYFEVPLEEQIRRHHSVRPYADSMLRLMKRFDKVFLGMKAEKGQMDFADANRFAIEILKDEATCSEIRENFDHIFIDEYQDSNYIQEELITRIKKSDNLFMVGDIKQSIYGFRMAEPEIFKNKYKLYSQQDACETTDTDESDPPTDLMAKPKICPHGKKIDLNTNFRSKKEVIDAVNDMFSFLMDDYDDDASLHKGDAYDGDISYKTELHIINTDERGEDEELAQLAGIEFEALLCANIIRESLGREIFDSKQGCTRPLEKKDIVILLRGAKNNAEKIYEILMNRGISAYIDDNSGYFDTVEINTVTDLLRIIDNRRQDIPLISVLRSGIFGFTMDELVRIRLVSPEGAFYEAFRNYDGDEILKKKIKNAIERIDLWGEKAAYMTTAELSGELIYETGYYSYAGALPGGTQRQANLRAFIEKAVQYDTDGKGTVFGFLRFIDSLKDKVNDSQAKLSTPGTDSVQIMTIHKSKGLEYPMVIIAGLGKGIQTDNIRGEGTWHKDIGFAMDFVDRERHLKSNTLLARAIAGRRNLDSLDEEIRILYVGATRAKDRLVLIGSRNSGRKQSGTYLSMLEDRVSPEIISTVYHSADEFSAPENLENTDVVAMFERTADRGSSPVVREFVYDKLNYEYPDSDRLSIKSKYSVSELNAGEKRDYEFRIPSFAVKEQKITGAAFGTIMHACMEHLDFRKVGKALAADRAGAERIIEDRIKELVTAGVFTEEEAAVIHVEKILEFFSSDLGLRICSSENYYKERQFNIMHEKDGHDIIVQGIIDCYFEEEDENGKKYLILVDYKTNYRTEGIEDVYREQMELYKEALEKATGLEVRESYLYLFSEDRALRM